MIRTLLCFNCVIIYIYSTTAQLSQMETLGNITACDLNVDIPVTCAADETIAVHSLQYAYDIRCGGTCCSYLSSDCFVNAGDTDIQYVRRVCSGKSSCNASISADRTDFATCSLGVLDISYIFLQYYCIPNDRISSICASGQTITSDSAPLYLTNDNYPSVTTGSTSCSCSLEVYSCSSSINLYTVDADLYLDTSTCLQNINFLNGSDQTLHTIGCESHYLDQIEINTVNSHYLKVDFINNSTANQEGYFFIGLEASESGASFSLSCNYEQETWCIGCGVVPDITHGQVTLTNVNDASYEATATVTCDSGYETQTPAISCLANGSWPVPVCTQKAACTASQWRCSNGDCIEDSQRCDNLPHCPDLSDEDNCGGTTCPEGLEFCPHGNGTDVCVDKAVGCNCGSVPSISNGVITTDNSTIGSVADVTCAEGYNPSAPHVTCLTSGSWETASCTAKDCGTLPVINYGRYEQVGGTSTTFGASANVVCDTGYIADRQTVTCQSTGVWESAACTIADCGTVPNVAHGNVTINKDANTTFAATAFVACEDGYESNKETIICQLSEKWETPLCKTIDKSTPSASTPGDGASKHDKSPVNIVLIIVLVILGVLLLVQLAIMCFLQCQIHSIRSKAEGGDSQLLKRIGMTVLGSIPIIGLIPIYITWREFYRDVYQVNHGRHIEEANGYNKAVSNKTNDDLSRNGTELHGIHADDIKLEHHETDTNQSNHKMDNTAAQKQSSTVTATPPSEHHEPEMRHYENSGITITRGISSGTFPDEKDDMPLDGSRRRSLFKQNHLAPIKQHPAEHHPDSHHHHFSKQVEKRREKLKPIMDQARQAGKHVELIRDNLYIDNCLYHPADSHTPTHSKTHHDMFY